MLEAFKDVHGTGPINNIDPVVAFTTEMYEIRRYQRKCRGNLNIIISKTYRNNDNNIF